MINVLISGITGSMGTVLKDIIEESKDFNISAGYAREDNNSYDFKIYKNINEITEKTDVIIDFSSKDNLENIINYALEKDIPLVLATTGYDRLDLDKINEASKNIPIVQSGNFSLGVNVMVYVSNILAKLLYGFDIEIIEKHHKKKKDSPSGTANMIFDSVDEARGNKLTKVYGREGFTDTKDINEVGIHSLRLGTINGEHEIIFAADDEVISLTHSASSKKIFALGSLQAAKYLMDKENGLFTMNDILNIGE